MELQGLCIILSIELGKNKNVKKDVETHVFMKRLTTLILILKLEGMNAKEKANRLFTLMWGKLQNGMPREEAKRCAIIAVDEILDLDEMHFLDREYWEKVKTEIEKL